MDAIVVVVVVRLSRKRQANVPFIVVELWRLARRGWVLFVLLSWPTEFLSWASVVSDGVVAKRWG